jgi:hypothetical protein
MMALRDGYVRCRPVKDKRLYDLYLEEHPYCQICGVPSHVAPNTNGGIGLSRHHIVKFGRSDEKCNLLSVCARCHSLAEGRLIRVGESLLPKLTLGIVLTLKQLRTPNEYNAERLAQLYGQTLPDLEQVPDWVVAEWKRWRGAA